MFGKKSLNRLEFFKNCVLEKSHRVSFGVGRHTTQGVIDCVHLNLLGPSQVKSLEGKRYFLSIVNHYSRRVWVYILMLKHETFGKFKEWKQLVENQTGRTVKKLRTHNGLELCNWKFEQLCIQKEIDSMRKNNTWVLVDHPVGQKLEKLPTVVKGKKPKADVKEKSTGVKDKVSSDIPQDKSKAKLPKPKQKSYSDYSSIIRSSGFKVVEEKSVKGNVKGVGRGSPMKSKVMRDMIMSTKLGDKVLIRYKSSDLVKDKVVVVKDTVDMFKDKVDVVKKPAEVVKDTTPVKDKVDVVKDKAHDDVVSVVKGKLAVDVVSDQVQVNVVVDNVKDGMVSDKVKDDVVKDNAPDVVKDKAPAVVKKKPANVKEKSAGNVVKEKLPTVVKGKKPKADVKEKSTGVKDKVSSDIPQDKSKAKLPKPKQKSYSDYSSIIRSSGFKPKKLKIKGGLKRERNGSDSDSLSVDEEKVRRMFNKLKKKNKKEESDEQNVPKKGKKKENALTPEEVAHEAHLLNFPTLRARTFPSSLFSAIHEARVNMEVDFLFKVNFLTLFTNTIGIVDGLKGQIYVDVVRRLREDCVISYIDNNDENGDDDDGNGDDDGDGNGDDDGNDKDSYVNDKKAPVEDDGGNRDRDGNGNGEVDDACRKSSDVFPEKEVKSTEKQSVDPTGKENGNALDAIDEDLVRMEDLDAGPLPHERLDTRVSKSTVGVQFLIMKSVLERLDLHQGIFFPTGCITNSMFDGTLCSDEAKCKSFPAQVLAQFKDNVGGLALNGIDLKKLFALHMKLYCYKRYAIIGKLKPNILKLKWRTNTNFKDCGIFTMLHMESFIGKTTSTWDCGLVTESQLQSDM
nr:retrovirus-related Pol polyprotein from transposon TNT 1-94 [Tanacetum cinerariifolium]